METLAPPSMHRERCLRCTFRNTRKEAKLHEGSASSMRSLSQFLRLSHNAIPNAAAATATRHLPARVI